MNSLVLVLSDIRDHLHSLLDQVLSDNLENLVLLKGLTRDVEGKILGIDDTLDEVEVFGNEVLAVVHDEDSSNVELDVVALLLRFEEVEGSTLGDEEDSLEFELTLNREVLDSEVVLPVVGERLVESTVLLTSDLSGVASPERLGLVEFDLLGNVLLDSL